MRRRHWLVVVSVVALMGTAVVVGLGHSGDQVDESRAPLTTPAPVPQPPSEGTVPGLTSEGISDLNDLFAAHSRSIREASYTIHAELHVRYDDDDKRASRTSTLRVAPNRSRITYHQHSNGTFPPAFGAQPRVDVWYDGQSALMRVDTDSGTRYARYGSGIIHDISLFKQIVIVRGSLEAANRLHIGAPPPGGPGHSRIVAATDNGTGNMGDYETVTLVERDGTIRAFHGTFPAREFFWIYPELFDWWPLPFRHTTFGKDFTGLHADADVRYSLEYTNLGNTTVHRPAWVEAVEMANQSSATVSSEPN